MFKGQELRKNKFTIDWETEERLKSSIVETIQQM